MTDPRYARMLEQLEHINAALSQTNLEMRAQCWDREERGRQTYPGFTRPVLDRALLLGGKLSYHLGRLVRMIKGRA